MTSGVASSLHQVRFGEFRVDLTTGELCKNGCKVILPEQPLLILTMLLERSGNLVTREELQQKLWPNTFVDAEQGLNAAMKRLRAAIGDDPNQVRFIETIPRKGYRFVAYVEVSPACGEDRFLLELGQIRRQLFMTNMGLKELLHRVTSMLASWQEPFHPKHHEALLLREQIEAAIQHLDPTESIGQATVQVSHADIF